jgi:hypothetical protein
LEREREREREREVDREKRNLKVVSWVRWAGVCSSVGLSVAVLY